jgi:large subunit ribosomal protein L4
MSLSLTVQDPTSDKAAKSGSKIELPAEVFDVALNIPLIHQVVVGQLAAARQGTSSTKTRGEVRGGGKKPYRQKGTGRARQGSTRAPQFTGGGVVHGPQPRSYEQRTPKKMKAAALRGALSDRARNDRVHVVSSLVAGDEPSTKTAAATLAKVAESRHVLVVAERADELTWKSLRNLPAVHLLEPGQLNTYDVLISDDVVFTQSALESFLGGPATGKSAKGAATSAEPEAAVEVEAEVAEVAEESAVEPVEEAAAEKAPAKKAPAKKAAAENATAEKAPAKKAPAKKAIAEKAIAEKATAEKATAEKAPAKKAAAKKAPAKKAADDTSDEEES